MRKRTLREQTATQRLVKEGKGGLSARELLERHLFSKTRYPDIKRRADEERKS